MEKGMGSSCIETDKTTGGGRIGPEDRYDYYL